MRRSLKAVSIACRAATRFRLKQAPQCLDFSPLTREDIRMTIFAKKTVPLGRYDKLQDQIAELQMAMGAPHDLMMMSTTSVDNNTDTIYIGLPDAALLSHFDGFEQVRRSDLPDSLTAVVLRHDGFVERFPDISRKLRAKR
jgi:hypothetical protein